MGHNLTTEIRLKAEFYDVDSMKIVWHGNYVKYMEQARCALLDRIGFNYNEMEKSGFVWPIVSIQCKYIRPIRFNQEFMVTATLVEYEHRLRIAYVMVDPATGLKLHKCESIQMAIDVAKGESLLVSPPCLVDAVHRYKKTLGL